MIRVELRLEGLEGTEVTPESVPLREVVQILELWNQALTSQAEYLAKTEKREIPREVMEPRLLSLGEGSIAAVLALPSGPLVSALWDIYEEIRRVQVENLPETKRLVSRALEALEHLRNKARNRNWRIGLLSPETDVRVVLEAETRLPAPVRVEQYSTVYGWLVRIGGDDPPRALLYLPSGERVSARLSRAEGKGVALAKKLAQYLYEWVGLRGRMEIRLPEHKIESILVEDIVPTQTITDVDELIRGLQEVAPKSFQYETAEEFLAAASVPPYEEDR